MFVLAVGDPDTGDIEVFDNTAMAGQARNERGQTTPEILSSSIGEALGVRGDDGDWWKG